MSEKEITKDTGPTMISKITVKSVGCNAKRAAALNIGDTSVIQLMSVIGIVSECKEKKRTNTNGEQVFDYPLIGNFEAVNLETGVVYTSGQCYLPSGMHEIVMAEIQKADVESLQFGMIVGAVRDTNAAGYTYVGKNLIAASAADPLAQLRNAAMEKQQALLPSPTQAANTVNAPTTAKKK